jgi:hypothetical protein
LWKNSGEPDRAPTSQAGLDRQDQPPPASGLSAKEGLRYAFTVKGEAGKQALDHSCGWAQRCRIPASVDLGRKIKRHRHAIDATLEHGLPNALIESVNTKIRLITRIAFGFKTPTPSSPWPCSPSAATDPHSPADNHPQI